PRESHEPDAAAGKRALTADLVLQARHEAGRLEAGCARIEPGHHDLRARGVLEAVIGVSRHEDGLALAELDRIVVHVRDALAGDEVLDLFGVWMAVKLVAGSGREDRHSEDALRRSDALGGDEPADVHVHPPALRYSGIGRRVGQGDLVGMLIDGHEIRAPMSSGAGKLASGDVVFGVTRILPGARRSAIGRNPLSTSASSGMVRAIVEAARSFSVRR